MECKLTLIILYLISNSSTNELDENTGYHISNLMSEKFYLVECVRLKSLKPHIIMINMSHVCGFLFCKRSFINLKNMFRELNLKDK